VARTKIALQWKTEVVRARQLSSAWVENGKNIPLMCHGNEHMREVSGIAAIWARCSPLPE
jgi:hypothetical protein